MATWANGLVEPADGTPSPLRTVRYLAAFERARIGRTVGALPNLGLRPLRQPVAWTKEALAGVLRDQLALLGPSGAETARILLGSEGLVPDPVVTELRRRPVAVPPLSTEVAAGVATRAFLGRVDALGEVPLVTSPLSQLHAARLDRTRPVLVRVRRPGASRAVRGDERTASVVVGTLERLVSPLRDQHPSALVELVARHTAAQLDLRREALNFVELALALEDLGADALTVARPLPGLVTERALVLDGLAGARSLAEVGTAVDRDQAVAAYVSATFESALACGVFHADLGPEQMLALPDGAIAVVGCGTLGRFDVTDRRAAVALLAALVTGDHPAQVAAMRLVGAVPDDVDEDALVADLAAAPSLAPMAMLSAGGDGVTEAVRDLARILLRHRLRPPLDVVLFVRALFAFRQFLASVAPETSPVVALMPLVQRLPELTARLDGPAL